jgi:hypothetical protein
MREPFDAAVFDYELPDLNGEQLAQLLNNVQPRVPIIQFSECTDPPSNVSPDFLRRPDQRRSNGRFVAYSSGLNERTPGSCRGKSYEIGATETAVGRFNPFRM